jgi:hypothetical protein
MRTLREAIEALIEETDEDGVYDGDDIIETLNCILTECEE